jgi:hypothetical protein
VRASSPHAAAAIEADGTAAVSALAPRVVFSSAVPDDSTKRQIAAVTPMRFGKPGTEHG